MIMDQSRDDESRPEYIHLSREWYLTGVRFKSGSISDRVSVCLHGSASLGV